MMQIKHASSRCSANTLLHWLPVCGHLKCIVQQHAASNTFYTQAHKHFSFSCGAAHVVCVAPHTKAFKHQQLNAIFCLQNQAQLACISVFQYCVCLLQDGKDKVRLEGPAVLDEGRIDLEEKKNLWPFTQIEPGGGKFHRGIE